MLTGLRHTNSYTQFVAPMNGDKAVKSAIKNRNKLLKLRSSDTDTYSREQYKRQRNFVTKLIKAQFQELGDKLRSKVLYQTLKKNTRTGEQK